MSRGARWALSGASLLAAPVARAQVVNPDFDNDLSGWTVREHGGLADPGTVTWDAGAALLREGDSHLIVLEQTVIIPSQPQTLSFRVRSDPGFDATGRWLPDALEAHLLGPDRRPLLAVWKGGTSASFNLQETLVAHVAPGASFDGTTVTLDISGLAPGSAATLAIALVGGDSDVDSAVHIDGVVVTSLGSQAPVADAGPDVTIECGTGGTTLDGRASFDPDGDALAFTWLDASGGPLGSAPTLAVDPAPGTTAYTLVAADPFGHSGADEVRVTVEDTTAPLAPSGPIAVVVEADAACAGGVPDLRLSITPTDTCSTVVVVQDVVAGTALVLDVPTSVNLVSTDDAGNLASTAIVVTLVDSDGSCGPTDTSDSGDSGVPPEICDEGKVTLCHVPKGHPEKAKTLELTATAARVHEELHGDDLGRCDDDDGHPEGRTAKVTLCHVPPGAPQNAHTVQVGTSAAQDHLDQHAGDHLGLCAPCDDDDHDDDDDGDDHEGGGSRDDEEHRGGSHGRGGRGRTAGPEGSAPEALGCDTSGVPTGAVGLLVLAALGAALRRRAFATWLVLLVALFTGSAQAADPIALDDVVSGAISTPGEVDAYTFVAAPGQRIYVQLTASSNVNGARWRLTDRFGREILRRSDLNDLGGATLMGGAYTLEVVGVGSSTATYTFRVADSPIADRGALVPDTNVAATVAHPGERHRYAVTVAPGQRVLLRQLATTNFFGLSWSLTDAAGRVVRSSGYLSDLGLVTLAGGSYVLDVGSASTGTGTYTIRMDAITDRAASVTLGGTVTGAASNLSSLDRWTFHATGGERVYLDVVSTANYFAAPIRLKDPHGNVVLASSYMDDLGPVDLVAGDWSVEVGGGAGLVPTYTLAVVPVVDLASTLTVGTPTTAAFTAAGQVARYAFTAPPGQRVFFRPLSSNSSAFSWSLEDSAGRVIQSRTAFAFWGGPYVLQGGDYTLTIDPHDSVTGSLQFELIDPTDVLVASTVGGSITGSLPDPGSTHTTSFVAAPGQLLAIDVTAATSIGGLKYEVRDSVGRVVLQQRFLEDAAAVALAGGSYTLVVSGYDANTGAFSMNLVDAGLAAFVPSGTPLALSTPVSATVPGGTTQEWSLDLPSARTLFFDPLVSAPGLQWQLLDPAGRAVFGPVAAGNPITDVQGPVALAAGAYTLRVTAPTTTSYSFCVEDVSTSIDTAIALGDVVADAFAVPGETLSYTFVLANPTDVYVDLKMNATGLAWSLVDEVGQPVFPRRYTVDPFRDDPGLFHLAAGSYSLVLDPDLDHTPAFRFAVHGVVDLDVAASIGDTLSLPFTTPGQVATVSFTATDGEEVTLDTLAWLGEVRWSLLDAEGTARFDAAMTDDRSLALTAGTWTLRVDPNFDYLPAAPLRVVDRGVFNETLAFDVPVTGTLSPGDVRRYTLVVDANTRAYLALPSGYLGVLSRLLDPVGDPVFTDGWTFEHGLRLVPGTYTFELNGPDSGVRPFAFTLHRVVDTTRAIAFGEVVGEATSQPSQVRSYTFSPSVDGALVMVNMIGGAFQWTMTDPVGQPVHVRQNAVEDLTAVRLAAGTYTVSVDANAPSLASFRFVVREGSPDDLHLYYTRYGGTPNVKRLDYRYDGVDLTPTVEHRVSHVPVADGIVIAPDGDLIVGGGPNVYKIDPSSGAFVSMPSGGQALHMSLDPSGTRVWGAYVPGSLVEIPLVPFGPGVLRPIHGDDAAVTHIAFDRLGRAFYTASGPYGFGSFGRIDLSTFTTRRLYTNLASAHGLAFDPFTDTLFTFGHDHITQIDPDTGAILAELAIPDVNLDQGTVDGQGHAFVASNFGQMVFVDYAATGRIDTASVVDVEYIDSYMDDVAPMSWLGAPCSASPQLVDLQPAAGSVFTPGEALVISGRVPSADPTRAVTAVLVNGQAAATLDAGGHFFMPYTVQAGANAITVEWFDRCGQGRQVLELGGDAHDDGLPSARDAVNNLLTGRFTDTTWNTGNTRLLVDVVAENTSDVPVVGPIYLAIGPELNAAVQLSYEDGLTAEGRPFVQVLGNETLPPGATTVPVTLEFVDPELAAVRFTPLWLATGNGAPHFTSSPTPRATADRAWSYDANATDPDGQPLTYTLAAGPVGRSINATTGLLSWTPSIGDVGAHEVRVTVADGFGGSATQTFVLSVDTGALNTPPVFATSPQTSLASTSSYQYAANAEDADGDALVYSLDTAPVGLDVDPVSGLVTWDTATNGQYPVSLRAEDGRGGVAIQSWTLTVGELSTNPNGPQITSAPPLSAAVQSPYLYQPAAFDRDGDVLTWALVDGPATMAIDPATGRVLWTPGAADVGVVAVAVEVSDGSNAATQLWEVTVTATVANQPPRFTSSPPATGVIGMPLVYDAEAVDPEAGTVTYAGTSVDPTTGRLDWTPTTPGIATIAIRATDPVGGSATQTFYVLVRDANGAPVVTSAAPNAVVAGDVLEHRETVYDPDADVLTFTLVSGPAGMQIDPVTGNLTWVTGFADVGPHAVSVAIADRFGGSVLDAWNVVVLNEDVPPTVLVTADQATACVDLPVRVCVAASDDVTVTATGLSIDGAPQALDALGCVFATPTVAGVMALEGVAADGSDNTGFGSLLLDVVDCSTIAGPAVAILTPDDGARLGAPIGVLAEALPAGGATVESWNLTLRRGNGAEVVLAGGSGDLPASTLATFDTTLIENGLWTLRLEVTDSFGHTGFDEAALEVSGDMKLGSYDLAFLDAEWNAGVTGISLIRSYSTTRKDTVGDFGNGWRLSMNDFEVWTNGPLGEAGWSQTGDNCGVGWIFLPVCYATTKPHLVVVKWPDGHVEAFDFTPEGNSFFKPLAAPGYAGRAGATSTLAPASADVVMFLGDGNLYTGLSATDLYDPQRFVLTDSYGTSYLLDVNDGLVEMTDAIGNTTRFSDAGIIPEIGAGVTFVRDGVGRIATMELPENSSITYEYDAAGDLVAMVDGELNRFEFHYDGGHRLTSYNVAGRPPIAVNVYGADGRLESTTDASGVLVTTESDPVGFVQTNVGPDPRLTTTTTYNFDGQAIEQVQAFDAESFVTSMTYDSDFQMATRTLPTGASESWTYDDAGRVLVHTDPAGVVRENTYGPDGQVALSTEGGEIVERTEFGADDLPAVVFRGDGSLLRRMTYDAFGAMTSIENGTGQVVSIAYAAGQINTVTLPDFEGQPDVIDVFVDRRGLLRNVTTAVGTTSYDYDSNGRQTAITDPATHVMRFGYDPLERMTSYTDKRGNTVFYTFDESGRELTRTSRNHEVLTRTYDVAGRLATMRGPGVDRELRYDPLGRLVYGSEGAHVETRSYDPFNLASIDVGGSGFANATLTTGYDEAGRLFNLVSPGMSATHHYDSRGRLASIVEASLGAFDFGYDPAGRRSRLVRPNGMVTTTSYNDAGQTKAINTGLVHQITTEYDERALPVAQTDQEGRQVYAHDVIGRLSGVDNPVGAAFGDDAYNYDAADRRTSNGAQYDVGDRLVEDADYTYAYDDEGRRISRTRKSDSAVTTYGFTVLDQLTSLSEGGVTWSFAYDARELRVKVTNDADYDERFLYDMNGTVRATFDASGAPIASYLTGSRFGEVLARVEGGGGAEFALRDRLGTIAGWLDAGGVVGHVTLRDAYGVRATIAPSVVPFGYTGHAEDPTRLIWGRARYYEPESGAWITEDPVFRQPRYTYAMGAPDIHTDASGRVVVIEYKVLTGERAGETITISVLRLEDVSRVLFELFRAYGPGIDTIIML